MTQALQTPAPVAVPTGERDVKSTITDETFDVIHTREDSQTFLHTKSVLDKAGVRCCITGLSREEAAEFGETIQEHHVGLEYSLQFGVNWEIVKGVATGAITELPVRNPKTHQPIPGKMAPVNVFMFYWFLQWTKVRGFDWSAFDPATPETFVDGLQNMIPLTTNVHIGAHGVHRHSGPVWLFFMWPRTDGFVYMPDEIPQT